MTAYIGIMEPVKSIGSLDDTIDEFTDAPPKPHLKIETQMEGIRRAWSCRHAIGDEIPSRSLANSTAELQSIINELVTSYTNR